MKLCPWLFPDNIYNVPKTPCLYVKEILVLLKCFYDFI